MVTYVLLDGERTGVYLNAEERDTRHELGPRPAARKRKQLGCQLYNRAIQLADAYGTVNA